MVRPLVIWPESCWIRLSRNVGFDCVCCGGGPDIHSLWIQTFRKRGEGWKESLPPPPQTFSLQYKHWAEREREKRKSCRSEREREGLGEGWQRDRKPWKRPCLPVRRIMSSLPRATLHHYPSTPFTPPLPASYYPLQTRTNTHTHSSDCSVYWWLKLAVSFRIHSQHWSSGTSRPNGLILTVYSCALSRMTHKRNKEASVCERGFPILVNRTYQLVLYFSSKDPRLPRGLISLSSFSPGLLSLLVLTIPFDRTCVYRRFFTLPSVYYLSSSSPRPFYLSLYSFIHSFLSISLYFSKTTSKLAGVDTVRLKFKFSGCCEIIPTRAILEAPVKTGVKISLLLISHLFFSTFDL